MFNWFKRPDYSNVIKFPEQVPYINPPEESVPESMYSIGVTSDGTHMTFKMGYTNISLTMTKQGCQQLIEQLEVFKNQLRDEE